MWMPSNLQWFGGWAAGSLSLWPSRRLRSLDCRGKRRLPDCGHVLQVGGSRESAPAMARSQLAPSPPPSRDPDPSLPPKVRRSPAAKPCTRVSPATQRKIMGCRLTACGLEALFAPRRAALARYGLEQHAASLIGQECAVVRACVMAFSSRSTGRGCCRRSVSS
jgi:hypothetical protein